MENKEINPVPKSKTQMCRKDFELCAIAGKGAYAKVYRARYLKDQFGPFRAIKMMEIAQMERFHKLYQIYLECDILSSLSHPNIVNVEGAFEEKQKIYIVLEYLSNGDFSDFLRLNFPFPDKTIRFYAGEILCALDYLHKNNVIHRDVKPENMMLDDNYHLKLIDFATAKINGMHFHRKKMIFETIKENEDGEEKQNEDKDEKEEQEKEENEEEEENEEGDEFRTKRGATFVGTAEYVSPEVLKDLPASFSSDTWALGIIIYQMYEGKTPFKASTDYMIFKKIAEHKIEFPKEIPEDAKDIILKLLVQDPSQRLGGGEDGSEYDYEHLKSHPFFKGLDLENLYKSPIPNLEEIMNSRKSKSHEDLITNVENKNEQREDNINNSDTILIIKEGILDKKSPWLFIYNKRKVKLDSTPKIEYIDPANNQVKGSIYLQKDCRAQYIDKTAFELHIPKRIYRFKVSML